MKLGGCRAGLSARSTSRIRRAARRAGRCGWQGDGPWQGRPGRPASNAQGSIACPAMVRVVLTNGRTLWLKDVADEDDDWLRGTNSRGRLILLSRERVRALSLN